MCDLIITSEETGIPVSGTCLLDQTKRFFELRRYINSERSECMEEIREIRDREAKHNNKATAGKHQTRRPVSTRSRIQK